jgi:hypothetical protein
LLVQKRGRRPLAMLVLNYALSSADPFITFQPTVLETGVAHGGIVSGTVAIQNKGFAPLLNAEAKLLKLDGTPAPSWMYSASDAFPSELAVGETKSIDLYMSPSSQIGDGVYQFKLRITGSNLQPQEMPIVVAVTQSGKGGVLVRAADIYTGTLDDNGQPIVGLAGASIRLQHDSIPGHFYTATTDNNGEAIFTDVPAGGYYLHGSSPGHNPDSKDIQVYPGITVTKELFLLNQLVTIEWSVVQILLQDFYEILLELIFETEVPFPVVVFEPVGTQLPDLKKGEVFMGELTLTNYGLINAIDVKTIFPVPDDVAQFEFLASIPETLAPKQSLKIPYRVTALKNFLSSDGQGGTFAASNDEAPCVYTNSICVTYLAICINGQIITASACAHWHNTHNCDDPAQIEGLGGGGGGGGGGAGGAGYSVESDPLPQFECTPWFDCTDKSAAPTQ